MCVCERVKLGSDLSEQNGGTFKILWKLIKARKVVCVLSVLLQSLQLLYFFCSFCHVNDIAW